MSTVASEFAVTKKELNWFFRQGVKGGRNLLWDDGMFLYLIGGGAALVVGESRQEGACYKIDGNTLRSITKASTGKDRLVITVSEDGGQWSVECDTLGTMSYDAESADDLCPSWLKHSGKVKVEISPETTAEVARIMSFTDTESTRYSLNGVHLENNENADGALAVSTDGRVMAVLEIDCEIPDSESERRPAGYLIPNEALRHAKMVKQGLCVVESMGVDCFMSGTAFLQGLEGNYPRWGRVLADATKDAVVVETLDLEPTKVKCDQAIAHAKVTDEQYPPLAIGKCRFNAQYVKDAMLLFDGHSVEVSSADGTSQKPAVFRSNGKPGLTVVIMPLVKE